MSKEAIEQISQVIRTACEKRELDWGILPEWEQIQQSHKNLPALREEFAQIKKQAEKLSEPPLQYGIYLNPCGNGKRDIVVGIGGTRLEVQLKDDLKKQFETLIPGQEVLLNKEQNVVAIGQEYIRGETAEVVNIIKPDDAAEILTVITEKSHASPKLHVSWREGEELDVDCPLELAQQLSRGDIVALDADGKIGLNKVRPRLHVKSGGSEGTIVEISDALFKQGVRIGDIVRIEPGLKFAFEKLPTYEIGGLALEEVPDVTYDDIGGLDEQVEQIYDAIELPYLHRTQFERFQLNRPKGILLYGPPGCGKTMVAKAVANNLTQNIRHHLSYLKRGILLYQELQAATAEDISVIDDYYTWQQSDGVQDQSTESSTTLSQAQEELSNYLHQYDIDLEHLENELQDIHAVQSQEDGVRSFFLNVKGPELLDKYVGETEHRIRKVFEEARRHASFYTPVVIFFDEMEAMFRTRGSGRSSDVETTIVPQFLSEIDGVEATEDLIIIGASNRQDMIDPAILRPGRLDVKIRVGRPDREATQDIFALYLSPLLPLSDDGLQDLDASTKSEQIRSGEIIFRTAYTLQDVPVKQQKLSPLLKTVSELLPPSCDLRLGRSLEEKDLEQLAEVVNLTIREAVTHFGVTSTMGVKLRPFKEGIMVRDVVKKLTILHEKVTQKPEFNRQVAKLILQEQLTETIILKTVELLFSPSSYISVVSAGGNHYTFPLQDFISGATIANIVNRAKKQAIKRALNTKGSQQGICLTDLTEAVRQEFEENKESMTFNRLQEQGIKTNEVMQDIEIIMESGKIDPWSEEKLHPYRKDKQ